jgi:uncharacterized protein
MKLKLLALAFCLCLPALAQVTPATTDIPASKEQIEKLFEVMDIHQQTLAMMGSMQQQMQAMTAETIRTRYPQITPAQMVRLNRISEEALKDFPVDGMLSDMIPIYQKHLNQADVDAMIAFYSSPTGKKLMQQLPQITQEAMQASYLRVQKQIDAAMQRVEDMVKAEKQEQQKKNPPAPNPPTERN